jgi:radical SAM-linked protein
VPKLRLTFEKRGAAAFIGHLDLQRVFQRAIRRGGVPAAYSEGFHPHPKLSFALPLPLGMEGLAEYADIETTEPAEGIARALSRALPSGITVTGAEEFEGKGSAARVIRAVYRAELPSGAEVNVSPPFIVIKKGAAFDAAADVFALEASGRTIRAEISAGGERSLRPDALVAAITGESAFPPNSIIYVRERLILK